MKKVLIISPHFPPSNLAGVHRSRLFSMHLPAFSWKPIILTVDEKYYEERLDYNLEKLLPEELRIEKVKAFPVTKFRLIGDLGLRAFFQLYRRARTLIKNEEIDFLLIPIPSFYCALLGRWLNYTTGIKYGIDYIDPWVHYFPGSENILSRHWLSTKIARWLEPIAVKKASLITGVAEAYYVDTLIRNPDLKKNAISGAMPYGGEIADYEKARALNIEPSLFKKERNKFQMVYAGAMLPKAYGPLEKIFKSIVDNSAIFADTQFYFIGTGSRPDDPESFNIKALAQRFGLWETVIFEYPLRIPYLEVLGHLNMADGIFILGSTEPHYTPSKVYQGILAGKPILAVLHESSDASIVLKESNGGIALTFNGESDLEKLEKKFPIFFVRYRQFWRSFDKSEVNKSALAEYSARISTRYLAELLNRVMLND